MRAAALLLLASAPSGTRSLRSATRLLLGRRAALSGLAATPLVPFAAAADSGADAVARLLAGEAVLDDLLARWTELTTDCNYGEIRRELLDAGSKQQLLEEASGTSKSATMVTVCKSTGRAVRAALGATADGPLTRVGSLLEKPALLSRVDYDDLERFQAASEALQQALSAADAAAYFSATGDFSAQTTFKRGETPTTPNLDAARQLVADAREALARVCRLVEAG